MKRKLLDRTEKYKDETLGKCLCGTSIVCVNNSSISLWKDKKRYRYKEDDYSAWNIFRCKDCKRVIRESFLKN